MFISELKPLSWSFAICISILLFINGISSQIILPEPPQIKVYNNDDFQCPGEQGYYSHPEYCEKYYSCWSQRPSLLICPLQQLFDIKYRGCNWAELTDCQDRRRPDGSGNTLAPPKSTVKPYDCPPDVVDAMYPDPADCASFYRCVHGTSYHHSCPPSLVFNEKTNVCDYKDKVNCDRLANSVVA